MIDSQNIESPVNKVIKDITSIDQLLGSYLVAESIIEIREERREELEALAKDSIPELDIDNEVLQDIYKDFAKLMNYNYTFVCLAKIGIEDMVKYGFQNDPSVMVSAGNDTMHLNERFGSTFSVLKEVSLLQHSLNVFNNAIETGRTKGRVMQIATPILGSLFHDFGKSEALRRDLLGEGQRPGAYKAHAEVSGMYIRERLPHSFYELTGDNPTGMLDALYYCVSNHHPKDNKQKMDINITLIRDSDMKAREAEFKEINYTKKQKDSEG